jgi:catechol 2,3-dioxygenase-like lactoylglutathione lyase family enzyme
VNLPRFGAVVQNAYVVRDLDAAVRFWSSTMGVGPFYMLEHVQFGPSFFKAAPLAIDMTVAIAQWGNLQIELIVQHNEAPSIYSEFLTEHGEGLQHLGVLTQDLDADLARLRQFGITPVQWGETAAGMRFAYLNTDQYAGAMVELIESGPAVQAFFEKIRRAGEQWDGSRPLRALG